MRVAFAAAAQNLIVRCALGLRVRWARLASRSDAHTRTDTRTHSLDVSFNHLLDELVKRALPLPPKLALSLDGGTVQQLNLSRAEVTRVDADKRSASLGANTDLVNRLALALPPDRDADVAESLLDVLLDRVSLSRREDKVVGLVLLQHEVHSC